MINNEAYQQYLEYSKKGAKIESKSAINKFVNSFSSIEEKQEWTKINIAEISANQSSRIRHEVFQEIVFPALSAGYKQKDLFSLLWLSRLAINYCQNHEHLRALDNKSPSQFLEEAYSLDPNNNEIRVELIRHWIDFVSNSQHEWPSGILDGIDGATIGACIEIKKKNGTIKSLDHEGKYTRYLEEYENKVDEYMARIRGKKP